MKNFIQKLSLALALMATSNCIGASRSGVDLRAVAQEDFFTRLRKAEVYFPVGHVISIANKKLIRRAIVSPEEYKDLMDLCCAGKQEVAKGLFDALDKLTDFLRKPEKTLVFDDGVLFMNFVTSMLVFFDDEVVQKLEKRCSEDRENEIFSNQDLAAELFTLFNALVLKISANAQGVKHLTDAYANKEVVVHLVGAIDCCVRAETEKLSSRLAVVFNQDVAFYNPRLMLGRYSLSSPTTTEEDFSSNESSPSGSPKNGLRVPSPDQVPSPKSIVSRPGSPKKAPCSVSFHDRLVAEAMADELLSTLLAELDVKDIAQEALEGVAWQQSLTGRLVSNGFDWGRYLDENGGLGGLLVKNCVIPSATAIWDVLPSAEDIGDFSQHLVEQDEFGFWSLIVQLNAMGIK